MTTQERLQNQINWRLEEIKCRFTPPTRIKKHKREIKRLKSILLIENKVVESTEISYNFRLLKEAEFQIKEGKTEEQIFEFVFQNANSTEEAEKTIQKLIG